MLNVYEETSSIINNELGVNEIEHGNVEYGIEKLESSAQSGENATALYNLAVCYEQGIGVEQNRTKACDYYRKASSLGHIRSKFNLTLLSNHIDVNDDDDFENEDAIEIEAETNVQKDESIWNRFSFSSTASINDDNSSKYASTISSRKSSLTSMWTTGDNAQLEFNWNMITTR